MEPRRVVPDIVINDKECVSGFDEAEIREKIK